MKTRIPILAALTAALIAGGATAQTVQTYRYDANGRLIAQTTARPSSGVWSSYALDDADNRTARNNAAISYPADASRMTAGESRSARRTIAAASRRRRSFPPPRRTYKARARLRSRQPGCLLVAQPTPGRSWTRTR